MIKRLLAWLLGPRSAPWYAVRDKRTRAWLVAFARNDAPAEWSVEFGHSVWFDHPMDALLGVTCAGLDARELQLVKLTVRAKTNHYKMRDVSWPIS